MDRASWAFMRRVASTVGAGLKPSSQLVRQRGEGEEATGFSAPAMAPDAMGRGADGRAGGTCRDLSECQTGSRDGCRRGSGCEWASEGWRGHGIRTT